MLRILVTGGAGFICSHVADGYIAAGHDVAIVDDLSRGSRDNLNPKARFYLGDVRDAEFVNSVFETERPEVVNHHAAQMEVRRGVREPLFDASVNILGSLTILQAAVAHGCKRVVYISTGGQHTANRSGFLCLRTIRSIRLLRTGSASIRSSTIFLPTAFCTGSTTSFSATGMSMDLDKVPMEKRAWLRFSASRC